MARVKNVMGLRVYTSGPMSGKPDFNAAAFEVARVRGEGMGHVMLIPSDGESYTPLEAQMLEATPENRAKWMRKDFHMILSADLLWVLDGWQKSEGARDEVRMAQVLGLPVISFSTGLPIDERMKVCFKRGVPAA